MPLDNHGCEECYRLWGECAAATAAHLHWIEKHRMARSQRDMGAYSLEFEVAVAEDACNRARRAIHKHQQDVHGVKRDTVDAAPSQ
jgi:hypothetical protein